MELMEMKRRWMDVLFSFCLFFLIVTKFEGISAQIRYSIQEELRSGTAVGNVAKDLALDLGKLRERNLRVISGTKQDLFKVNSRDGVLSINQRIDREELCAKTVPCITNLKVVVENPLEMHQIIIEILDVNDNSPKFPEENYAMEVLESAVIGTRFQVEGAHDLDVGINSIHSYKMNHNQYFQLDTEDFGEEGKVPFLVLQRPLDREQTPQHWMLLTATDGGKPPKSGTMNITIKLSDINDNSPVCDQQKYVVTITENAPVGTFLLAINASDSDEGLNGMIEYSLRSKHPGPTSDLFDLNSETGKLTVKGQLNYEDRQIYELKVLAADKGSVSLSTQCIVVVKVEDINDNPPEIEITSLSSRIREDAAPGTVVALMGVTDLDSGVNGQVVCSLSDDIPFDLKPSPDGQSYSLITKDYLDKENTHMYNIKITAKDLGSPSLSSIKLIQVDVLDMNDNRPLFTESPYSFYVHENNKAGLPVFSVTATDADEGENAAVSYFLDRKSTGSSLTSFLNINEADGTVSALKSFDFESLKILKTFQFKVIATDSGTPSLSSNVTVNVFILDQNDNTPVILYPVSSNGSAEGVEEIPRNVNAGHLVTKVRAYDADIGYNGWLLFSLQEVTDHSLFGLDRYTGQIRTLRSFTETDEAEHKLVILVKDNGNVSLSATATVIVKLVEPKEAFSASDDKRATKNEEDNNMIFYLIITLGSVSLLFIISIIILIAMQCSKTTDYSSKYLQETNYDGTLCHSIQYRSGDKRYMLVGPRMSIGSTIVPGSHANTLVLPDRRKTSIEVRIYPLCFFSTRCCNSFIIYLFFFCGTEMYIFFCYFLDVLSDNFRKCKGRHQCYYSQCN
uniref:Protocadherin 2 alpha a 1 n=1 Tax=Cyprinodon variegatus TaxID=28743 RepID=A0A3Q2CU62_CYPVA